MRSRLLTTSLAAAVAVLAALSFAMPADAAKGDRRSPSDKRVAVPKRPVYVRHHYTQYPDWAGDAFTRAERPRR